MRRPLSVCTSGHRHDRDPWTHPTKSLAIPKTYPILIVLIALNHWRSLSGIESMSGDWPASGVLKELHGEFNPTQPAEALAFGFKSPDSIVAGISSSAARSSFCTSWSSDIVLDLQRILLEKDYC